MFSCLAVDPAMANNLPRPIRWLTRLKTAFSCRPSFASEKRCPKMDIFLYSEDDRMEYHIYPSVEYSSLKVIIRIDGVFQSPIFCVDDVLGDIF